MDARGREGGFVLLSVMLALSVVATIAYLLNRSTSMDVQMGLASGRRLEARYVAEAAVAHAFWRVNQANCNGYTDLPSTPFGAHSYAATVFPTSGPRVGISATGSLADGTKQTYSRADLEVFRTLTVTLQPGTNTDDVTVDAVEANKNYGDQPKIIVSNFGPEISHALLRLDLSTIPVAATITSAELKLYLEGTSVAPPGAEVAFHRVTQDWLEGTLQGAEPADGATWLTHDGATPWAAAGGDVDPIRSATLPLGPVGQSYDIDVTVLVKQWHESVHPNYGVRLEGTAGVKAIEFMSGDDSDVAKQPQLIISYRVPCPPLVPPNTEVLQPVADTYLEGLGPSGKGPRGMRNYARIGVKSNGDNFYALLRFDVLSAIPANVTVSSAILRVYEFDQVGPESFSVSAHKVMADDWIELFARWTRATLFGLWTAGPGGTFDASVLDTATVNTGVDTREWDVTALVQEWVDGVSPDYGVQLIHDGVAGGNYMGFYSRNSNQPEKPTLTVTYVP